MASPSLLDVEQRNRLPTLYEVLSRRTLAPVDLFSFYIYMRDQQRSVDYLDFWYVHTIAMNTNLLLFLTQVSLGWMYRSTCPSAVTMSENYVALFW